MAPNYRPRPDLEELIPQSILNKVERKCSRLECQSKDVVMRYFNNNDPDQPRFFCNGCERFFTLGGKLRESYRKAKSRTGKAKARTKTNNLQDEGAEIGEGSRMASRTHRRTRSSRLGLSQTTNRVGFGIETKAKSKEFIINEKEIDCYDEETKEVMESEKEDTDEDESETEDTDEGESETKDMNEDESEGEDGESHPLDLNNSPHQESNIAKEDEEIYEVDEIEQVAKETNELVDSRLPREGNVDGIPRDEVPMSTEETPMVLDTTLREELHPRALSRTKLLMSKTKKHLDDAQAILEKVHIEKLAIKMELEWQVIEQQREQENRTFYPDEEMHYALKQRVVEYMSLWREPRVGPLNRARYEVLVAREASLEKVGESVESLAREVDEMENALVPHAMMVKIEKKAKRLFDCVVVLSN